MKSKPRFYKLFDVYGGASFHVFVLCIHTVVDMSSAATRLTQEGLLLQSSNGCVSIFDVRRTTAPPTTITIAEVPTPAPAASTTKRRSSRSPSPSASQKSGRSKSLPPVAAVQQRDGGLKLLAVDNALSLVASIGTGNIYLLDSTTILWTYSAAGEGPNGKQCVGGHIVSDSCAVVFDEDGQLFMLTAPRLAIEVPAQEDVAPNSDDDDAAPPRAATSGLKRGANERTAAASRVQIGSTAALSQGKAKKGTKKGSANVGKCVGTGFAAGDESFSAFWVEATSLFAAIFAANDAEDADVDDRVVMVGDAVPVKLTFEDSESIFVVGRFIDADTDATTFLLQATESLNAILVTIGPNAGQEGNIVATPEFQVQGRINTAAAVNGNCWVCAGTSTTLGAGEAASSQPAKKKSARATAAASQSSPFAATITLSAATQGSKPKPKGKKSQSQPETNGEAAGAKIASANSFGVANHLIGIEFDVTYEGLRLVRQSLSEASSAVVETATLPLPSPTEIVPETLEVAFTSAGIDDLQWNVVSGAGSGAATSAGALTTYQYLTAGIQEGKFEVLSITASHSHHQQRGVKVGGGRQPLYDLMASALDDAKKFAVLVSFTWHPGQLRFALREAGGPKCLAILRFISDKLQADMLAGATDARLPENSKETSKFAVELQAATSTLHYATVGVHLALHIVTLSKPLGLTVPERDVTILYAALSQSRVLGPKFASAAARLRLVLNDAVSSQAEQPVARRQLRDDEADRGDFADSNGAESRTAARGPSLAVAPYAHRYPHGNDLSSTVASMLAALPANLQQRPSALDGTTTVFRRPFSGIKSTGNTAFDHYEQSALLPASSQ